MTILGKGLSQRGPVTYGRVRRHQPTAPLTSIDDNGERPSKRLRTDESELFASRKIGFIEQSENISPGSNLPESPSSSSKYSTVTAKKKQKPVPFITRKATIQSKNLRSFKKTKTAANGTSTGVLNEKKKKQMTQMLIDFDGLGAPRITCKTCGMSYSPSSPEDATVHKKFHAKSVGGVDFALEVKAAGRLWHSRGSKGSSGTSKTASAAANISNIFSLKGAKASATKSSAQKEDVSYVIAVEHRSSASEKKKAFEVLEVANTELGSVKIPESVLWSEPHSSNKRKRGQEGAPIVDQRGRYRVFLYISGRKCVGLCLAERIRSATPMDVETMSLDKTTVAGDSLPEYTLGISRLWTCSSHRRAGVASTLVDCATKHFYYGLEVDKEKIAFSMPTESGAKFALSWISTGIVPFSKTVPVYTD